MPITAVIAINSTSGSEDDIVYGSTVNLTNVGDGSPTTYLWTLVSKPANSAAFLNTTTSPTCSFTADAEGTYLIRLVVNGGELDEATDQVIAAVRELQTRNRIPAAGETIENNAESDDTGWAHEAVDQILQRVTRLTDANFVVAQAGEDLLAGDIVYYSGSATLGSGANSRAVPVISKANATVSTFLKATLGYVDSNVAGGAITEGALCRVLLDGVIAYDISGGSISAGAPLYVGNDARISSTTGNFVRKIGTVVSYSVTPGQTLVAVSGYGDTTPYGIAGGDLAGNYPDPTVNKISGATLGGSTPVAGQVLRATSTSAASWGAVDLADTDAVTGILPYNRGGTGNNNAFTTNGVAYGETASKLSTTGAASDQYKFLRGNSVGPPTWDDIDLGTADVTGNLPVAKIVAGTTSQVLVGNNGSGDPVWGTVPTGAFAANSIPWSAILDFRQYNALTGTYTNNTNTFTEFRSITENFSTGLVTFSVIPKEDGDIFEAYLTTQSNGQSAIGVLKFEVTGPSGFTALTYNIRVRSSVAHNNNQITGNVSFPVINFLATNAGEYTIKASAAVVTSGDTITIVNPSLYVWQG